MTLTNANRHGLLGLGPGGVEGGQDDQAVWQRPQDGQYLLAVGGSWWNTYSAGQTPGREGGREGPPEQFN
jgi:hypothetical protein